MPITPTDTRQLFDQIVETLVTEELMSYRSADPFRKDLPTSPFLLMPPRPKKLDLDHLAALMKTDGRCGKNYLDPKGLHDTVVVPRGPYLILGIEDGKKYLNVKPSVAEVRIVAECRSPFTCYEGIVYSIVFGRQVFTDHNVYFRGSRYRSEEGREGFPHICLSFGETSLGVMWHDRADLNWGAPSCDGRRCRNWVQRGVFLARSVARHLA